MSLLAPWHLPLWVNILVNASAGFSIGAQVALGLLGLRWPGI